MTISTVRVALPDGGVATRRTARTYTHVICARGWRADDWGALVPVRWAGRSDLARKQVVDLERRGYTGVVAVPVPDRS